MNTTPENQAASNDPHQDLNDDLAKAMDELGVGPDDDIPIDDMVEISPQEEPEAKEEAKAEEAEAKPAEAEAEVEAKAEEAEAEVTAEEEDPIKAAMAEAPSHWLQTQKEAFARLEKPARDLLLERDRQYSDNWREQMTRVNGQVKFATAVDELMAPYRETFKENNITPVQAVSVMLQRADHEKRDPAGFIRGVAQIHGLDLADLAAGGAGKAGQEEDDFTDPALKQVSSRLDKLAETMEGFVSGQQQERLTSEEARHAEMITGDLNALAQEVDSGGELVRPYFEQLLPVMQQKVIEVAQTGRPLTKQVLADVYEDAVWANPETREAMLKRKLAAAASSPAPKPAAVAKATQTVVPSQNTPPRQEQRQPLNPTEDLNNDILAAIQELGGDINLA